MESDMILDEQIHKKGRHRKKQLYNSIMQQMEFYFSDSNLVKDKFLLPIVEKSPEVDISIFLKFNKIRKLTTNPEDVIKAINNSQLLELTEDKTKVKRKTPIKMNENVDNCTLYVERIKVDATHEWLASIFSEFGTVNYVSIPKYKHNKVNKGFAFVEFEKEEEATEALNYFESIGCRMSALIAPDTLCSIVTYEGNKTSEIVDGDKDVSNADDDDEEDVESSKKRRHSKEESDENRKKIKVDNLAVDVENVGESVTSDDYEEKKRKKHKKMKKKQLRELGMQVLSKLEWKKIRNRYLDNQKAKMKQLKQFLHRKRFTTHAETKQKSVNGMETDTNTTGKEKQEIAFVPGVIVKIQLSESYCDIKKIKEDLKQYSSEIKYVDVAPNSNEGYLRFADNSAAVRFCGSDYKGHPATVLKGEEEVEYWSKINTDRSQKFKKNQKRLRGREKLLKKAEKELGKHIKFDDAD
ncbi:lupus la protein-related [Holotrichia oblita]|uniref:Lupus la protein-related n=1 Tax=Holotrichia oblita TaxID=644536 RepID=A0ACB9TRI3_HOLOL|nr:lupus la protein-related [Holotrichia oblita]